MGLGKIGLGVVLIGIGLLLFTGWSDMGTALSGVADNVTGGVHASDLGEAWMSGQPLFLPLTFLFLGLVALISGIMDRGRSRRGGGE